MKHILLAAAMILSSFANANEMSNPCVYHPDLPGCAGNNRPIEQGGRVINIPSRWGAIYYNAANQAIGYSENNTKGYRSANKEALANCIKAGGGKDPLDRNGEGCSLMTEFQNRCGAIALGSSGEKYRAAAKNATLLSDAEQKEISACEAEQSFK